MLSPSSIEPLRIAHARAAAEVVDVDQREVEPLPAGPELRRVEVRSVAEIEKELGVPPADRLCLSRRFEQLDRVLADGVEQ